MGLWAQLAQALQSLPCGQQLEAKQGHVWGRAQVLLPKESVCVGTGSIYNCLVTILWGVFKNRGESTEGKEKKYNTQLLSREKWDILKCFRPKQGFYFLSALFKVIPRDSNILKHGCDYDFCLAKDLLLMFCGIPIASLCLKWSIAIHPHSAVHLFTHPVRKDQIPAHCWASCTGYHSTSHLSFKVLLKMTASLFWCVLGGWGQRSPMGASGMSLSDASTADFVSLALLARCLYKSQLEVFSFPVSSKELSKLEKLFKQELSSPQDQVMLYSVFIWGRKNFHNPVVPLFILFKL